MFQNNIGVKHQWSVNAYMSLCVNEGLSVSGIVKDWKQLTFHSVRYMTMQTSTHIFTRRVKRGKKSKSILAPPPRGVSSPRYVSAIRSAASTQAHIRLDTWVPCRIHDGCHGAHIATGYTCTGCCLRSTLLSGGGEEGWNELGKG